MIKFENKNNGRFYYIQVKRDMLNDLVLTVFRGGHHLKVVKYFGFSCGDKLQEEIDRLAKRRLKRGYSLVTSVDL